MRGIFLFIFLFSTTFALEVPKEPMLIVIRHGTATHDIENRYNCNPNHPGYFPSNLTTVGKEEVTDTTYKLLALGFNNSNIEALYVSPLPRTRQTAEILVEMGLVGEQKVKIDPDLTEIQVGDLEGKPCLPKWEESFVEKYHTETDQHMKERIATFYKKIKGAQGNVIVVTHGLIADTLLHSITGKSYKLNRAQAVIVPLHQIALCPAP